MCGLKFTTTVAAGIGLVVTPFMGVWIEILLANMLDIMRPMVTPFMGVWIEISGGEGIED